MPDNNPSDNRIPDYITQAPELKRALARVSVLRQPEQTLYRNLFLFSCLAEQWNQALQNNSYTYFEIIDKTSILNSSLLTEYLTFAFAEFDLCNAFLGIEGISNDLNEEYQRKAEQGDNVLEVVETRDLTKFRNQTKAKMKNEFLTWLLELESFFTVLPDILMNPKLPNSVKTNYHAQIEIRTRCLLNFLFEKARTDFRLNELLDTNSVVTHHLTSAEKMKGGKSFND